MCLNLLFEHYGSSMCSWWAEGDILAPAAAVEMAGEATKSLVLFSTNKRDQSDMKPPTPLLIPDM